MYHYASLTSFWPVGWVMPRAKGKESSNASSSMSDDMIDPAILMQNDFSVQARRPTCP